ncbi:MAG: hypothetical protein AAF585_17215 [Verrucomicrobiota bacterium]
MSTPASDDQPLQMLKHEAVSGYLPVFLVAFLGMAAYLAWIIVSSPGKIEKDGYGDKPGKDKAEAHESH